MSYNNELVENKVLLQLKDFQRVTVERIAELYRRKTQNRILVADEVGLGKTLIARGVIAKTATIRKEEGDDLFRVVYVCSNLNIAKQNLGKLKISKDITVDDNIYETRLSMQHLRLAEQDNNLMLKERFVQLIALTPSTSFQSKRGIGNIAERALMFCILKRIVQLNKYRYYNSNMGKLLKGSRGSLDTFRDYIQEYDYRINSCARNKGSSYPANIIKDIMTDNESSHIIDELTKYLDTFSNKRDIRAGNKIVGRLRALFAKLSTKMLNPDLVIMDEFQRFKYLIDADNSSDEGILAHIFLQNDNTRVLLLSATPYKLYSTLDEIYQAEANNENAETSATALVGDHYKEFKMVTDFLFAENNKDFPVVWSNYSYALQTLNTDNLTCFKIKKTEAEEKLYQGICRTERIAAMENGDFIDDSSKDKPMSLDKSDILSYLQFGTLLKEIEASFSLPMDYVKSCPYLMSFMRAYKLKSKIGEYFSRTEHIKDIEKLNKPLLWLKRDDIEHYKELPSSNARLEQLKDVIFSQNGELLLWVPPSKPYYELQGAYKGSEGFSKVLVFSAWEMVPRMIGAMISYEAERRTIGKLVSGRGDITEKNKLYFADSRYPTPRLKINKDSAGIFCLLYPSKKLKDLYDAISYQDIKNLKEIEKLIVDKLRPELELLKSNYERIEKFSDAKPDAKWYYYAPMLLDGVQHTSNWCNSFYENTNSENEEDEDNLNTKKNSAFGEALKEFRRVFHYGNGIPMLEKLGKMPEDLLEVLVNVTLGSPAVCAYRAGFSMKKATEIAKIFLHNFNSTESTAIIDLIYKSKSSTYSEDESQKVTVHWKNVLRYCKDGCFQAMLDEYVHLLREEAGFSAGTVIEDEIFNTITQAINIRSANYTVDTYNHYSAVLKNIADESNRIPKDLDCSLRANFAVGYIEGDNATKKNVLRKDNIRRAFNSPVRPFVLATTSIGQEGLDFHTYCRKIMHWNLPSNPIDLEQREGRINRFKCLAIRQNIAKKYGDMEFNSDIWTEMFAKAAAERNESQSELVPFWCMGNDQEIKIERILPLYPLSKDGVKYERLIKILSLYRLTLGQARQEELIEYLYTNFKDKSLLNDLFISLCPYEKSKHLLKPIEPMPDPDEEDDEFLSEEFLEALL